MHRADEPLHVSFRKNCASLMREAQAADRRIASEDRKRRNIRLLILLFALVGGVQLFDAVTDLWNMVVYFLLGGRQGGQFSAPGLRVAEDGSVDILLVVEGGLGHFIRYSPAQFQELSTNVKSVASTGEAGISSVALPGQTHEVITEKLEMGIAFDVAYSVHSLIALFVSLLVLYRLTTLLRHLRRRYDALRRGNDNAVGQAHTMKETALQTLQIARGPTDTKDVVPADDAELKDEVESEALRLRYRRAAIAMFALEDVPAIVFTTWRLYRITVTSGLTMANVGQLLLSVNLAISSVMAGKLITDSKSYLKDDEKQRKTQDMLATFIEMAKTILDEFPETKPGEREAVTRVRKKLVGELENRPSDVGGDVMLLRHFRASLSAEGGALSALQEDAAAFVSEELIMQVASSVHNAFKWRATLGADIVREQILREDKSFNTLPQEELLQIAFPHNMCLGFDRRDNLVQFEAWGGANMQVFRRLTAPAASHATVEDQHGSLTHLASLWLYRLELQNMLLMAVSHHRHVLCGVTLLIDAGNITTEHAHLREFLRERSEILREVYPLSIQDIVVANVARDGAAPRVLEKLSLPSRAVLVDQAYHRIIQSRGSSLSELVAGPKGVGARVTPVGENPHRAEFATKCREALGVESDEALRAWCNEACAAELAIYEDHGPEWTEVSGPAGVKIEVRHMPDFPCRLHRFSVQILGVKASSAFRVATKTIGTPESVQFGDLSVLEQKDLAQLDGEGRAHVLYQASRMPRGVSNRHFIIVSVQDAQERMVVTKDLRTSVRKTKFMADIEREHLPKGLVLGQNRNYGFRFLPTNNDRDCIFTALICVAPRGNIPSVLMNSNIVGATLAKGIRGMARAIEALARSFEYTYAHIDVDDETTLWDTLANTEPSVPQGDVSALVATFATEVLPRHLGGSLALGAGGLCCAGVDHEPISKTLGRAVLLRTLSGVSESECEDVSSMIESLESGESGTPVDLKALPPHVGGEVALLRFLRDESGDVGSAISRFNEALELRVKYGFDVANADIVETEMSFSEVPGNEALQRVYPHNWDLGRTDTGNVVRYDRFGATDVDGLVAQFPLDFEADGVDGAKVVEVEDWVEAIEQDSATDIATLLRDLDVAVRAKVDEILKGRLSPAMMRALATSIAAEHGFGLLTGGPAPAPPGKTEEEPSLWRYLGGGSPEIGVEFRIQTDVSKLRQYRYTVELPAEILGEVQRPEDWFEEALTSLRSKDTFIHGDRSVERSEFLAELDEGHNIFWQTAKMPRGVSDRDFLVICFADRENLACTCQSLAGKASNVLADQAVGLLSERDTSLVRGRTLVYGFAFRCFDEGDGEHGCTVVFYEHIEPLGSVPAKLVNLDRVGVGRSKGVLGMVKALIAARTMSVRSKRVSQAKATHNLLSGDGNAVIKSAATFRQNVVYRLELQTMLLDRLSRLQRRVTMVLNLFDVAGLTMNHRRTIPYLMEEIRVGQDRGSIIDMMLVPAATSVTTAIWSGLRRLLPAAISQTVKLLNTSGSSLRAREAMVELTRYVPTRVLPRSLGGAAAFGDGGHCCSGFAHVSFLRESCADFEAEAAARLLESFADVRPGELEAVRRLAADENVGDALRRQPPHVGGGVALLRLVRSPDSSTIERAYKMLDSRQKHDSAARCKELTELGLSLHALPGSAELPGATLHTNDWVGLDTNGDIVTYERWGAIEPTTLLEKLPVAAYARWSAYRWEARAMVLDAISRRARRVVRFAVVIDAAGTKFEHRKLMSYVKEFAGGGAAYSVPGMRSTTHVIHANHFASMVAGLVSRTSFVTETLRKTMFLISGDDPFAASADFAARFGRHVLPAIAGGTLQDAHCCLDVQLPAASDVDALWERYELQASPAVEGSQDALRTLGSIAGVVPAERSGVRTLLRDEVGTALLQQPAHIGGGVALVRLFRDPDMPAIERSRKMLALRQEYSSAAKCNEIREQGLSLHTLPGSAELREAKWQTNEWIGIDEHGDVVAYERWGAFDPTTLLEKFPVQAYAQWSAYRWEARAMVLDSLSRRARRVVRFAAVIDGGGIRLDHRKLMDYFKEFASGGAVRSVPDLRSTTHFIRVSNTASTVYSAAQRAGFVNVHQQATTFLISGQNPFTSSTDFSVRFGRRALPTTVGGTLQIGDASTSSLAIIAAADAHCCVGVVLPTVSDTDALWRRYKTQLDAVAGEESFNKAWVRSYS